MSKEDTAYVRGYVSDSKISNSLALIEAVLYKEYNERDAILMLQLLREDGLEKIISFGSNNTVDKPEFNIVKDYNIGDLLSDFSVDKRENLLNREIMGIYVGNTLVGIKKPNGTILDTFVPKINASNREEFLQLY